MPWVVACFDLLATPFLGYCIALRKLALQAGVLQGRITDLIGKQIPNTDKVLLNAGITANMVPNTEEQRQGKVA